MSECWNWDKCTDFEGYGLTYIKNKVVRVHRVSYRAFIGKIPSGMHVCHSCDNRKCVNPNHLFLGTHNDNMRDGALKNRFKVKLTIPQVLEIRHLSTEGFGNVELAKMFGITRQHVGRIVSKKRRVHV